MKYLGQKPSFTDLNGRTKYTTNFIDVDDIKNKNLLDVGCGFGWFTYFCINSHVKSYLGIDVIKENLEISINDFKDVKDVSFKNESILDIKYDQKFDTVTMWEVIEHLPLNSEINMFSNVYKALSKGGSFYLSTPYHSFLSYTLDPAYWLIGHRHYNALQLIKVAIESGFVVEKVEVKGKIFEILATLNLYIAKWVFRRPPFFENWFNEKRNNEFNDKNGYANIYFKFKKL